MVVPARSAVEAAVRTLCLRAAGKLGDRNANEDEDDWAEEIEREIVGALQTIHFVLDGA